jgi:hypothetical protein
MDKRIQMNKSKRILTLLAGALVLAVLGFVLFCVFSPTIHRVHARESPCVWNLELIHDAELTWMSRTGKSTNAVPTWNDLKEELERDAGREGWTNGRPVCPQGGTYILSPAGEYPKCSLGGPDHSIPKR